MITLFFFCRVKSAGAVSYADIDECTYRREVHFCYDLKLPEGFLPNNLGKPITPFLSRFLAFLQQMHLPSAFTIKMVNRWRGG